MLGRKLRTRTLGIARPRHNHKNQKGEETGAWEDLRNWDIDNFEGVNETMSRNREPVFWGGFFKRNWRSGYEQFYKPAFAMLPKMRCVGDTSQLPEIIVIIGSKGSTLRGTGKTTLATHFHYSYWKNDFPVIYFGTGDEVNAKYGIEHSASELELKRWEREWRAKNKRFSYYQPKQLRNVYPLCPPGYRREIRDEVIDHGGEVLKFPPSDMTRSLLLAYAMVKGGDGVNVPNYMTLANKICNKIADENLGRAEAIKALQTINLDEETGTSYKFEYGHNKGAIKKVADSLNEVYTMAIDPNAPTLEERIKLRKHGKYMNYMMHYVEDKNQKEKFFFTWHVFDLISRINKRNLTNPRFTQPVVILDDAGRFMQGNGFSTPAENSIVDYINLDRKYCGPLVVIAQYPELLHPSIIGSNDKAMGSWTHLFECLGNYKVRMWCKQITRTYWPDFNHEEQRKLRELAPDDPMKFNLYYTVKGGDYTDVRIKPPETWQPT